jgi:hypothetical protein
MKLPPALTAHSRGSGELVCQQGGFETWLTALGAYNLSAMPLGDGQWSWLVRRGGLDIVEGRADSLAEAQQAAEAAAGGRSLPGLPLRAEAQAEVERLEPLAERARELPAAGALRRPRAFWISMCNIIGLLCSVAGVVLLFWFALPNAAPGGPEAFGIGRGGGPAWEAENQRYDRLGHIGLVLVVIGTLMEAVLPPAPRSGSGGAAVRECRGSARGDLLSPRKY